MENQHRQIKGYRELSQFEIDTMNKIKTKAAEVGALVDELRSADMRMSSAHLPDTFDQRWVSIGATELQLGFMALTRAVTKPDFF